MAKPIDPESLVETHKLVAGRYAQRTLCEIGSTVEGLKYLRELAVNPNPPDFAKPAIVRKMIEKFISRPDRQKALHIADGTESRRRR